jgi:RimJ/RimL family protein N-acetyltransferase
VETERLLLRQWRPADIDAYAAIVGDPEVGRFLGDGLPVDRNNAWRQMAIFAGHWQLRGYGNWAVELRATGQFIGRAGLWQPLGWPGLEVGWVISPSHQGRGYATEVGRVALALAWERLGVNRVISLIRPDNVASIAVARKLGGVLQETIDFMGESALVYGYAHPSGPVAGAEPR